MTLLLRELSRRSMLRGAAAAAVAGGLVACWDSDTGSSASGSRTVPSIRGPIEVPDRAQRVVCLDLSKIQRMLDVGCRPVGVPVDWQPLPEHAGWYAGVAKVGLQASLDIEKIAELRPDLMLGSPIGVQDAMYRQLSQLAPVVLLDAPGIGSGWKRLSAADADAAGRGGEMSALRNRYAARVAQLHGRHLSKLDRLRWAVVYGIPGAAYVFLPAAGMGEVLTDLGATFAEVDTARRDIYLELSYEQLSQLADADIILLDGKAGGGVTEPTRDVMIQPTFEALPAARVGHAVALSHLLVFSYGEAMALLEQIDQLLIGIPLP